MKLPRDVSGHELAKSLGKFGYQVTRQTGSHIRLTSTFKIREHHITIPRQNPLKIGTLAGILSEVASYLKMEKEDLSEILFK